MSSTKRKNDQKENTIEVRKSIVINASPEVVFKAITDPQQLTQWFPDQAILEPRIGGKMKFFFQKEKSPKDHAPTSYALPEGTVKEFIPNKKLSYTWKHMDIPELPETLVTWNLDEIDVNKRLYRKRRTQIRQRTRSRMVLLPRKIREILQRKIEAIISTFRPIIPRPLNQPRSRYHS